MQHKKLILLSLFAATLFCVFSNSLSAPKNVFTRRYMKIDFDWHDRWNDPSYTLIDRASAAGYNGLLIRALYYGLDQNPTKMKMVPKLKDMIAYAEKKGLVAAPVSLCVIEGSEVDPNLSEVLPVKGTPFLVTGGTASVKSDHTPAIANGGFDEGTANRPANWHIGSFVPGQNMFLDKQQKKMGTASLRIENPAYGFITQRISGLKPYRAYQLSIWAKTEGYTGSQGLGFMVQAPNTNVYYYRRDSGFDKWGIPAIQPTFRKFACDFNTLDVDNITLRVMMPAGKGKFWLDDIQIKEVGLYEVIRRPSCPVKVRSEDGSTTYTEGKDYDVRKSPIRIGANYPLGNELTIPSGSRIKSGDKLRVDWFQHGDVESFHAPMSYCAEGAFDLQQREIDVLDNVFDTSKAFYAFIDEWRVGGYDPACSGFKTAGEYMSWVANVTDCQLRKNYRNRDVYVCNDMYDPYHNGGYANYFATRGGTIGSHKNLPSSMIILNWLNSNGDANGTNNRTYKSLRHFGGLDPKYPNVFNRQILSPGFAAPGEVEKWEWSLSELEKEGLTGVIGMVYVTWVNDYTKLESGAQFFKDAGRWGTGPIPFGDMPHKGVVGQCDYNTPKPGSVPAVEAPVAPASAVSSKIAMHRGILKYTLKKSANVSLSLFDAMGRSIKLLETGRQLAGTYTFDLDKLSLSSGIFIARLKLDDNGTVESRSRKMVIF